MQTSVPEVQMKGLQREIQAHIQSKSTFDFKNLPFSIRAFVIKHLKPSFYSNYMQVSPLMPDCSLAQSLKDRVLI